MEYAKELINVDDLAAGRQTLAQDQSQAQAEIAALQVCHFSPFLIAHLA